MHHGAITDPYALARRLERVPLGRMGTVAATVTAVLHLASDAERVGAGALAQERDDRHVPLPEEHALIS